MCVCVWWQVVWKASWRDLRQRRRQLRMEGEGCHKDTAFPPPPSPQKIHLQISTLTAILLHRLLVCLFSVPVPSTGLFSFRRWSHPPPHHYKINFSWLQKALFSVLWCVFSDNPKGFLQSLFTWGKSWIVSKCKRTLNPSVKHKQAKINTYDVQFSLGGTGMKEMQSKQLKMSTLVEYLKFVAK